MENTKRHQYLQTASKAIDRSTMKASGLMSVANNKPLGAGRKNLLSRLILFISCLHVVLSSSDVEEPFPKEKCEKALPACKCEDYVDVVGLICKDLRDFDVFTRVLSYGSLFEVNVTLDIDLSGAQVLLRGFLNGLRVQRLFIDDVQTGLVEDGAFEGMLELRKFQVKLSSMKYIPDFRAVKGSLRSLYLDNSQLTSISGQRLKNLPQLQTISFVNNSIQSVEEDAFEGTENVIIFDLSYNQVKALPQTLFHSWKKLKKVSLTSNHLLHVDQLFAVARPSYIFLDRNNLTNLDSILFPNMSEVETLNLAHNPFNRTSEHSFNGKVSGVRFLFMDHCLIREFNASHFKDLPLLSTLDLSCNQIEEVTHQTIQFGTGGVELYFSGNKIKEFDVNLTYRVEHVYLNKNRLTSVSRSLQYSQVKDVSMADNRIETLGPEDFRGVYGVQSIDLQRNMISSVDPLTFKGVRRDLEHLHLGRNLIRSLRGCVRNLYRLTSLNLTGNQIVSFEAGEFQGLEELLDLYLEGNHITTLGIELQPISQLRLLDIRKNEISVLKPEQLPKTLKFVYLKNNPLKCDCQMLSFFLYINSSDVGTDRSFCTPPPQASLPPPGKCPEGCLCSCTQDKDKHFVSVDCSSAGLTEVPTICTNEISATVKENCSSMAIQVLRNSETGPFVIEDEIGSLNLSHNALRYLAGAHLPAGLRHLLLHYNLLREPPLPLLLHLQDLVMVTLSGNPWSCDCNQLSFKRWILRMSQIVMDANETRCGEQSPGHAGRVIWSLTDMDLCPVHAGSSPQLFIGLLCFFVLVGMGAIFWNFCWTNVKLWLAAHGITWFQRYSTIQSIEFENNHLLEMNGVDLQRRAEEMRRATIFPQPTDRQDGYCLFQELSDEQSSRDKCVSLTSQSKLPV